MRDELADHEWVAIKPMLPNKPRVATRHRAPIGAIRRAGLNHHVSRDHLAIE